METVRSQLRVTQFAKLQDGRREYNELCNLQ